MKALIIISLLLIPLSGVFARKADTSKVEWIKVYFNGESDHSYAWEGNKSNHKWDMIGELVTLIDNAKFSVDLAAYDLQNMRVGHALANAKRRGVRVRVITDIIHREHAPRFTIPMWDTLRKAGIISFDDSGTIYWPDGRIQSLPKKLPNSGANMHHKFCVIDAISQDPDDMYLWTGTMNITYTGPWNTNATLVIKDSGVTLAYFEEFNQMWGSKGETPKPDLARFHKDKLNVKRNVHFVDSIRVEVYFGPMDRGKTKPSISARVTDLITNYCLHDARFIAFAISSNIPISQAMLDRSARGEIILQGVIDPAFYARYKKANDVWARPESRFGNRYIVPGKEIRKLHSKIILLDATYPYPNKHKAVTIVGSYNFSKAAEEANDENILIIFDNHITNQFYQDFMGIMSRAEGKTHHQYPDVDPDTWYDRMRFRDGQIIEVELATNLYYPVSLLGIKVPRMWAGDKDSTFFFSEEAFEFVKSTAKNKHVRLSGADDGKPEHRNGRYYAFVELADDKDTIFLNQIMLLNGFAQVDQRARGIMQDSIINFRKYEEEAAYNKVGIWAFPDSIGKIIQTPEAAIREKLFPLDLNSATEKELEFIPSIGPGRAKMIVDFRTQNGLFFTVDDLLKIKGIGPATLEKLKPYVVVATGEESD
jgi:competence ComEA-like helix-hairpin-helix protein